MEIKGAIDLMTVILKFILPVTFIFNVSVLIVNMVVNAMFRGRLSIKVE